MFVFRSRADGGSVFSDDALSELCTLHSTLTTDATPSGPYVGYQSFCLMREAGSANKSCFSGFSPLAFFYGDDSYAIDRLDLAQFLATVESPRFETIAGLLSSGTPLPTVVAQYPAEGPEVAALMQTVLGYMGHWLDSPIHRPSVGCDPALRKPTDTVLRVVAACRASPNLNALVGDVINYFFDADFGKDHLHSMYTRASYDYGAPLKHGTPPYQSSGDRSKEQEAHFITWFWRDARLQSSYDESDSSLWRVVQPTGLIPPLLEQMLLELLIVDGSLAIAPLLVVFLVVWFQTRSAFLALATIVECTLSFTAATLVVYAVGIRWMAFEQFLGVYIVLAIGADDVFVFVDCYKASFHMGAEVNASLTARMSWVYGKAGLAMLITSLTTACAFVVTAASSPIPTLQNFGVFAATVILFDYLLVMTFLCACVVVYHNYFEVKPGLCCAVCTCAPPGSVIDWWLCYPSKLGGCGRTCSFFGLPTTTELGAAQGPDTLPTAKPLYIRLFEDTFPFDLVIKNSATRAISIVIFLGLLVPAVYYTAQLSPQTSAENFLPESHPFQRFYTAQSAFSSSREDETVEMQLVYGFDPDDPIALHRSPRLFSPDAVGTPRHSPTFTLDPPAQLALLDDCSELDASDTVRSLFIPQSATTTRLTFCWIAAFRAYRQCLGQPFPVNANDVVQAIEEWMDQPWSARYTCGEEVAARGRSSTDAVPGGRYDFQSDIGWRYSGTELEIAWVRLRADSRINVRAYLPASELRLLYDEWSNLTTTLDAGAPASLGSVMHISSQGVSTRENKWLHMVLQETYVTMALTGVAFGLGVALIVLLVATRNLIVSILSIVTIAFALCCVVGTVVWQGWQLGSAESLSMMILTGFAVDYVVHLAHAYMESRQASRVERVHDALRALGISVFWGMLTSIIAAGVLSRLQLQFFSKFGTFFLYTILWSYLWAVLFFMPLLAFIGPKGVGPHAEAGPEPHSPSGGRATIAPVKDLEMPRSPLMSPHTTSVVHVESMQIHSGRL